MHILVDYDNVHELLRHRGLPYIAQQVADAVGASVIARLPRLRMRLYGGWLESRVATKRAQAVAAEAANGPFVVSVTGDKTVHRSLVAVELAWGPVDEPKIYFSHTFRKRSVNENVRSLAVPYPGCRNVVSCPIGDLERFLKNRQCSMSACNVAPKDVLVRDEQKLVDTMLVTDLLALSRGGATEVAVVSTDDDMWPGVRLALTWGVRVFHIHPVPGRSTPSHLLVSLPGGYSQATLI